VGTGGGIPLLPVATTGRPKLAGCCLRWAVVHSCDQPSSPQGRPPPGIIRSALEQCNASTMCFRCWLSSANGAPFPAVSCPAPHLLERRLQVACILSAANVHVHAQPLLLLLVVLLCRGNPLAPAPHFGCEPGAGSGQKTCSASKRNRCPQVCVGGGTPSKQRVRAGRQPKGAASAPTCVQRQAPVLPHGRGCIARLGRAPAGALPGGLLGIQGHANDNVNVRTAAPPRGGGSFSATACRGPWVRVKRGGARGICAKQHPAMLV